MRVLFSVGWLLAIVGCGGGSTGVDSGSSPDAGNMQDVAGSTDADSGTLPTGSPRDGLVGMHDQFACVRRPAGTVDCFATQLAAPQLAPLAGATSVARLGAHTRHAVRDDGSVLALNPGAAMPVAPVDGLTGVTQYEMDRVHWLILADGSVRWRASSPTFVPVDGITGAAQGATYGLLGCAVLSTGSVQCATFDGTLTLLGVETIPGVTGAAQVTLGNMTSAVRLGSGRVQSIRYQGGMWTVADLPGITDAADVACADRHCCVLHAAGSVSCWGMNDHGQLGSGTTDSMMHPAPAAVPGVAGVVDVATTQNGSMVVLADGTVMFWGVSGFAPRVVM